MMNLDRYGWRSESRPDLAKPLKYNPMRRVHEDAALRIRVANHLNELNAWTRKMWIRIAIFGFILLTLVSGLNALQQRLDGAACNDNPQCQM